MRAANTKANIQSLVKNLAKSNLKSPAKSPAKRAGAVVDHQEVNFEIVSCSSGDDEQSIPTPKSNNQNNSSQIMGSKSSTNK